MDVWLKPLKPMFEYTIGKVYWSHGPMEPFEFWKTIATNDKDALGTVAQFAKPNHMQTLTIVSKTPLKKSNENTI